MISSTALTDTICETGGYLYTAVLLFPYAAETFTSAAMIYHLVKEEGVRAKLIRAGSILPVAVAFENALNVILTLFFS